MLLLLFRIEGERFGLNASDVVEVIPVPSLRPLPRAPEWLGGLFTYHGAVVPVLDLSSLLSGRPSRMLLSTRVILVRRPAADGKGQLVGMMAEQAVETVACHPKDLHSPGVRLDDAPYLGDLVLDEGGSIQTVSIDLLLPSAVRDALVRVETS